MKRLAYNGKRAAQAALAGYCLVILLGYAVFELFSASHRERQSKLLAAQADAISAWYESMFSNLSDATGMLKTEFERDPQAWREGPERLQKFSETIGRRNAWVPQISIMNEKGILIASNLANAPGTDISDRWHFRVHKEGIVDGLFISDVVVGRTTGRAVIQFTRALRSPDGMFRGITVFSISVDHLANPGWSEGLAGEQELQLVRNDGSVIFTSYKKALNVEPEQKIDRSESDLLRDALVLDRPVVRYALSGQDIVAFRKVPEFRLLVRLKARNIFDGPGERQMMILGAVLVSAAFMLWTVFVLLLYRAARSSPPVMVQVQNDPSGR